MAKNKKASEVTRLTKEELSKLTQEELAEYASKLAAQVDDLEEDNEAKDSKLKAIEKKAKKESPVTFEIEEPEDKAGEYEFTAPSLTWDDNNVYDIRSLSESDDKKEKQLYEEICAKLVQRDSGLVARRKED